MRILFLAAVFSGSDCNIPVVMDKQPPIWLELPRVPRQEIQRCVGQLGSSVYLERKHAYEKLHQWDVRCVRILQDNQKHTDVQVRLHVGTLLRRFHFCSYVNTNPKLVDAYPSIYSLQNKRTGYLRLDRTSGRMVPDETIWEPHGLISLLCHYYYGRVLHAQTHLTRPIQWTYNSKLERLATELLISDLRHAGFHPDWIAWLIQDMYTRGTSSSKPPRWLECVVAMELDPVQERFIMPQDP